MAFVFTTVGILMIVTGVKGTYAAFGSQVAGDFTGSQPFTYWVLAIIGVGSIGYIDSLRTVSRLFLTLILVSMIIANKGFFNQLTAALKAGPIAPAAGTGAPASSSLNPASSTAGATGAPNTGSAGQGKFNQYMNTLMQSLFGGGS